MPELPEMEVIKEVLACKVVGLQITSVEVLRPLVVRTLAPGVTPERYLSGRTVSAVSRRGKLLCLGLEGGGWMVVNPMLAGRLYHNPAPARRRTRDYLALGLSDGTELVYHDAQGMGKIYLAAELSEVPGYAELGPEPLDPAFTLETFLGGLARSRGEIKGVLTRGALVAGIGNAYADEILFEARIFPMRRCTGLSPKERENLYWAVRGILGAAVKDLRTTMGEAIHLMHRGNLRVHNRKGEPCPRCGNAISEVKVGGRATSFCRHCQPGTMFD